MATVIAAFLYWRFCCFHNSDCSVCEVNIYRKTGASQKGLIGKGARGGLVQNSISFVSNLKIL